MGDIDMCLDLADETAGLLQNSNNQVKAVFMDSLYKRLQCTNNMAIYNKIFIYKIKKNVAQCTL